MKEASQEMHQKLQNKLTKLPTHFAQQFYEEDYDEDCHTLLNFGAAFASAPGCVLVMVQTECWETNSAEYRVAGA